MRTFILFILCGMLVVVQYTSAWSAALHPPPGYQQPVIGTPYQHYNCPAPIAPFTSALTFPSKYEGSGHARDRINRQAEKKYLQGIRPIREFERRVVQLADKYVTHGADDAVLACLLDQLLVWAEADALLPAEVNHIGQAVRKWALASVASAWLKVQYAQGSKLHLHRNASDMIEAWFGRLADQVVLGYSGRDLKHINNHDYWAGWAVTAAAVAVDREDLFDWGVGRLHVALQQQVDENGFLPNELRRRSRALLYHNFALKPLVMIAVFAKVNGRELSSKELDSLKRLVGRVTEGLRNPAIFFDRSGARQVSKNLTASYSLAWMLPWATLVEPDANVKAYLAAYQRMGSIALGGDLVRFFQPFAVKTRR